MTIESIMHSIVEAGEMRVELDKKSLFALASDTRLEILKALQPMRRTVSQLADSVNIDKAAVHRHLKKLEEGGLVKRYEDHGFVYYGLSWKARDLLSPNDKTRVIILLSVSWIFIFAALAFAIVTANLFIGYGAPQSGNEFSDQELLNERSDFLPWFVWTAPSLALGLISVTFVLMAMRYLRIPKQKSPPPEDVVSRD